MKRTGVWKNRFILLGMIIMALLFISGCSGDDLTPDSGKDPTTPWLVTATADTWLTTNPYGDKHDGGWVYSAREDVIYAMYGNNYSATPGEYQPLYRIDHILPTSDVATTFLYDRHGSHPVIDSTGAYIYQPPSQSTNQLERYNTSTGVLETLAPAPTTGTFSHGAWKNGKLWIVLDDGDLYSYDPVANTWSTSLHDFGSSYANVASSGPKSNLIYVIVSSAGTFYSYDVTNGTVTPLTTHPYGYGLGGNGQFIWFGANVGFIYAVGGCSGTPAIYDIAGGVWQDMADPKPNSNCVGHATYDTSRERLYVAGGDSNAFYYQF